MNGIWYPPNRRRRCAPCWRVGFFAEAVGQLVTVSSLGWHRATLPTYDDGENCRCVGTVWQHRQTRVRKGRKANGEFRECACLFGDGLLSSVFQRSACLAEGDIGGGEAMSNKSIGRLGARKAHRGRFCKRRRRLQQRGTACGNRAGLLFIGGCNLRSI